MTLLILVVIFALFYMLTANKPAEATRFQATWTAVHELLGWAFLAGMIIYLHLTFK